MYELNHTLLRSVPNANDQIKFQRDITSVEEGSIKQGFNFYRQRPGHAEPDRKHWRRLNCGAYQGKEWTLVRWCELASKQCLSFALRNKVGAINIRFSKLVPAVGLDSV
jgi:hypothetical protein